MAIPGLAIEVKIDEESRQVIAWAKCLCGCNTTQDRVIVKCHEEDEFDVEFGRKLALYRLHRKVYKKMFQQMCDQCEQAKELLISSDAAVDYFSEQLDKYERKIDDLVKNKFYR